MLELILGTYGSLCWLVFKKWKLVPTNTYTVCTAILIGAGFLAFMGLMLIRYHPASDDARLYVYTTPIVPSVKGIVKEISMTPGQTLHKNDPMFQIDPTPYQMEVQRLEAALDIASTDVGQLEEKVAAAAAAVAQASATIERTATELKLAETELARVTRLLSTGAIAQQRYDMIRQNVDGLRATLTQAQAAKQQAEAQERDVRLGLANQVDGQTPEVREILAQLSNARWELEQTTVRAPGDGYAVQMVLREGQMAVPLPLSPAMIFVHDDKPELVASFPQNVIAVLAEGQEAELAFKAYPGRVFPAKVKKILPAAAEGQLSPSGTIRTLTPARAPGRIPVIFEYGDEIAALKLPGGSQAIAAVYTDDFHALSIMRKIVLRIKSWENYLFLP
ncbi:MAG: HlyD family secretion protein [Pseudomonadales bacterium]|nr:HlyD family secretion protein [Pseudomonadales bacterium]